MSLWRIWVGENNLGRLVFSQLSQILRSFFCVRARAPMKLGIRWKTGLGKLALPLSSIKRQTLILISSLAKLVHPIYAVSSAKDRSVGLEICLLFSMPWRSRLSLLLPRHSAHNLKTTLPFQMESV